MPDVCDRFGLHWRHANSRCVDYRCRCSRLDGRLASRRAWPSCYGAGEGPEDRREDLDVGWHTLQRDAEHRRGGDYARVWSQWPIPASGAGAIRSRGHARPLQQRGVATKVEPTGKVFPASDRALDVRDALWKQAVDAGAEFLTSTSVTDLRPAETGWEVQTSTSTWPRRS